MIKALQSRSNKKAIISNLDGYESEIIDNMVRLIKVNTKCNDDHGEFGTRPNMKMVAV